MGLQAYFYDNQTAYNLYNNAPPIPPTTPLVFSIPVATVDQDFDLYPMPGLYEDFVVKYEGYITATESGTANLQCLADDGCIVIIDGVTIIDEWYDKGTSGDVYPYQMIPNQSLSFTVWYYENGGGAVIQLRWQLEDRDWTVVPEAVFSTVPKVTPIPVVSPNPETQTVQSETVTASETTTASSSETETTTSDTQTSTLETPSATVDTPTSSTESPTPVLPVETSTVDTQTAESIPTPVTPLPDPVPVVQPEPVVVPPPAPEPEPLPEPIPDPIPEPEPEPTVDNIERSLRSLRNQSHLSLRSYQLNLSQRQNLFNLKLPSLHLSLLYQKWYNSLKIQTLACCHLILQWNWRTVWFLRQR